MPDITTTSPVGAVLMSDMCTVPAGEPLLRPCAAMALLTLHLVGGLFAPPGPQD
jgi:sorbitol-specific phosphotransferase system component IIBC